MFFAVLLSVSITTYFWIKATYLEEIEKNMSQNIDALIVSLNSLDNLDAMVQKFKDKTNLRLTIINAAGKVIAESHEDKHSMDNHLNRKEIVNLQEDGVGKIIRHSKTIDKDLLYIAKKVKINDETIYIRMADSIEKIQNQFIGLTFQIMGIFAVFIIFVFIITYIISHRIRIQTDKILQFLTKLTKKDAMSKSNLRALNSRYTQEFFEISRLLRKVAVKLSKKNKLKAKHTARLKLANQQKDEIISAISHEFKNPIAIISGYTETIMHDKTLPKNMQENFLKKIHSNANKMSALIDRLRLTLKLEEGKQDGFYKECSLKLLTTEIISDLKQKYKNREIVLDVIDDITLNIDETLMTIAISNLIENALKYSEEKVTVEITKEDIKVIDMGIGITANDLEKIQNKFYRVSKNDWNNSLGLGLFIVSKIINLHGFELQIESEFNFGSKFIIKF